MVKAVVVARVRKGETIRAIAADLAYGENTISGHWRHADPAFAAALDEARRHALIMADRDAKLALLRWLIEGGTVEGWVGGRRGRKPGPGRAYGVHDGRQVRYWRARDPWFAGEYNRLLAARARPPQIDLADVEQRIDDLSRTGSLRAAGLGYDLVRRLHRRAPSIHERIVRAWKEGRRSNPRKGRPIRGAAAQAGSRR